MLPDAFGCAVANRFGDLDDDADPFDLLSEAEKVKEKKKKKKEEEDEKRAKLKKAGQKESQKDRRLPRCTAGADPGTAGKQPQPPPQQQQQQQQQQTRPGPVAGGRSGTEAAPRGAKKASKQEEQPQEFSIPKPSYNPDFDTRGRGGASGRRAGGTRISDNMNIRGKREYDRHNGTGVSPEEKRGGRGPWNWGCVDEAASELMEVLPDIPVKPEEPQFPLHEENQTQSVEDSEIVVHVAMEMSLDEWKALQQMSRHKAEFNIRKAEDKIPSKAKVIHQSRHPEKLAGTMDDVDEYGNFLRKSVNDITSMLDINFGSLDRPRRGGRGRGNPVGPGGRPERAKPPQDKVWQRRGAGSDQWDQLWRLFFHQDEHPAPNPDNQEEFPALPTGR